MARPPVPACRRWRGDKVLDELGRARRGAARRARDARVDLRCMVGRL